MLRFTHSIFATWRDRGLLALIGAIYNHLIAAFMRDVLQRRYIERKIHNYRMFLDLKDRGLSRSLLLFATREVDHKVLLERIVKSDMTIYDIGANIGYYPLMELGLIGPGGKLIAIEPVANNIQVLKKNLALNNYQNEDSNVEVLSGAVSNSTGTQSFHLSSHSNLGTFHPSGSASDLITGETVEVPTFTVPELAGRYGPPDLIRMDVEGHEVEILDGMIESIKTKKMQPSIIFETHLTRYSQIHSMERTLQNLFRCNYGVSLAATSQQSGTDRLAALGYTLGPPIITDGVERVIIENIENDHAIQLICHTGGLRTVVLSPH
mgnify:CR=1 FL=1|tara:strand:- start:3509 stop:4474 length:966 start_codon:yes stop_codon:yes gene_type:complete